MVYRKLRVSIFTLCIAILFFSNAWPEELNALSLVTVTGNAELRIVPDEVILTFGVETWNKELDVARDENDGRVKAILDLAEKHNIDSKHVQTDYIKIEPRFRDQREHREFIGYFVRKNIVFTLRDISRFESLLSDALKSGANYVYGVQFRTTDLRKYRDEARALAVKAAREKAAALAGELGVKIGNPHSIREEQSRWLSSYNARGDRQWGFQNVIQNVDGAMEAEETVAPGQINIVARVTVSFELK